MGDTKANEAPTIRSASSLITELLTEEGRKVYEDGLIESSFVKPEIEQKPDPYEGTFLRLFGPRFANQDFDTYQVDPENRAQQYAYQVCKFYADNIKSVFTTDRQNLILAGLSGTGKNHLAYAIAKRSHKAGQHVIIKPFLHIMQEIKASYTFKERSERQILDEYIMTDLLIIEEIGVSFETDAEKIYLFDILDGRYKYAKPTIIITNFSEDEFRRFVDFDGKERVWDRLQQTAYVIPFTWTSYRKDDNA